MKLSKNIRHRLFAGETVELAVDRPLRRDGVYAIHTEKGTRQGQFRVLVFRKGVAVIRFEGDPIRLLSRGGGDYEGRGYTDFPGRAMLDDPGEAVDEDTQQRFVKEAAKRAADRSGDWTVLAE